MKLKSQWKLFLLPSLIFLFFLLTSSISPSFASESWKTNKITPDNAVPSSIKLEQSRNGFGLVWVDNRESDLELYYSRLSNLGRKIGKEIKLTDNEVHDETPALVWNGKDYALFWSQNRSQIYFMSFNENGKKIIQNKSLEILSRGYAIHVSAVWSGEEYGVIWWDVRDAPACNPSGTRGRAFFVRVDRNGQKIGEEIPVSNAFSNPWQDYQPLIVWDGENYVIFWGDSKEGGECTGTVSSLNSYMAKVSKNGEKILGDIKLPKITDYSQLESVIWDGNSYVITYRGNPSRAFLAKVDKSGNKIFSDVPINTVAFGSGTQISLDSEKYYVAWMDGRDRTEEDPNNIALYYTAFDLNGNKLIHETKITDQSSRQSGNTRILFTNNTMGLGFIENANGVTNVYFASKLNSIPKAKSERPKIPKFPSIPSLHLHP